MYWRKWPKVCIGVILADWSFSKGHGTPSKSHGEGLVHSVQYTENFCYVDCFGSFESVAGLSGLWGLLSPFERQEAGSWCKSES